MMAGHWQRLCESLSFPLSYTHHFVMIMSQFIVLILSEMRPNPPLFTPPERSESGMDVGFV